MLRASLVAALLLTTAPPSFEGLREKAAPVESLKKAVTALVGRCDDGDAVENAECRDNLKARRKAFEGKRVYLFLGAPEVDKLRFEGERGDKVRLLWTPIHDAGNGMALTVGKPSRVSPRGGLVIKTEVIDAALAPGVLATEVQRLLRIGQLNIELVGRFGKPWSLTSKGERTDGITFELEGIRFSHARTGKPLLERVQ